VHGRHDRPPRQHLGVSLHQTGKYVKYVTYATLGLFLLVTAFIPAGDMLVVLRYRGSRALAYGMHGGTAAVLVVTGALLLLG